MSDFQKQYSDLIITQFYKKPKAKAEIELFSSEFESIYHVIKSFEEKFDLDNAVGDQLDKIGKLVGQSRIIQNAIPKVYFGFSENENARGFGQAPFFNISDNKYSPTQLNDYQYLFFIKARIAKNNCHGVMQNDTGNSIQDVIQFLFNGGAYVLDNKDMTLNLYVYTDVALDFVRILRSEDLLPAPMGVDYKFIKIIDGDTFGFSENENAKGFGQGVFAELIP